MKQKLAASLAGLVLMGQLGSVQAVAPTQLPVQGFLTDASGVPVDGTVILHFSLYPTQSGGTALWSEEQSVQVLAGVFSAYLGSVHPLDHLLFNDLDQVWLGITVGTDAEMPRLSVGTQPFASYAEHCGNQSVPDAIPSGAVMMFNLASCPPGWSEFTPAAGRYLVGLPPGGTLGASAGSALSDQENRAVGRHNHSASSPPHSHDLPIYGPDVDSQPGNAGSDCDRSSPRSTDPAAVQVEVDSAGAVDGTNAPYVQLRACVKD